jgi:hypothetical protein
MSICSDVYITKEEAIKKVTELLMYEQEKLIKKAIEAMDSWELGSYLNKDSDIYYYNVEDDGHGESDK